MSERDDDCALYPVRACGVLRHPETFHWLIVRGHDPLGRWHLPGGRGQVNEPPTWTVLREIREELGIRVTTQPRLMVVTWTQPSSPDRRGKVTFVFDLGLLPADTPITPNRDEIAEWAWQDPDTLDNWLHPLDAQRAADINAEYRDGSISYLEQRRSGLPW